MCLALDVVSVSLQPLPLGGGRDERRSWLSITRYYILEQRWKPYLRTTATTTSVPFESFWSHSSGVFQIMLSLNRPGNTNLRRRLVMQLTLVSIPMMLVTMSRHALVVVEAFFDDAHPWLGHVFRHLVDYLLIRWPRHHHLRPLRPHRPTRVAESSPLPRSMRLAQLARLAGCSILLLCHK